MKIDEAVMQFRLESAFYYPDEKPLFSLARYYFSLWWGWTVGRNENCQFG